MSSLVLGRKLYESIMIGNNIKILVSKIQGGKKGASVRLQIEAPEEIKIYRQEIYDKIQNKENL